MPLGRTAVVFVLSAPVVLSGQAPGPVDGADRSGEPLLRRLLVDMGRVRNVLVTIGRTEHSAPDEAAAESAAMRLWLGPEPGVFRFYRTAGMGGSLLVVQDGRVQLRDSLGARTVTLADPSPSFGADGSPLSPLTGGSVLFWAFDGEASLPLLAPEGKRVAAFADREGLKVVECESGLGTVRLFARETGEGLRIVRSELQRGETRPSGFGSPVAIVRDTVLGWEPVARFAPWVFETKVPEGFEARDERKPAHR